MKIKDVLFKEKEIGSLDGLRALACLAVILAHIADKHSNKITENLKFFLDIGKEGVALFFTISGFIITLLLIKEKQKRGTISFRHFYFRRFIKIVPVLYIFLFFLLIFVFTNRIQVSLDNLLSCFLFYKNYSLSLYSQYTGHVWSLANEEHFYLFWPIFVLIFNRKVLNFFAIFLIIISPVFRVLTFMKFPEYRHLIDIMTHCRLDSFMIGCLIAINFEYLKDKILRVEIGKLHLIGFVCLVVYFFILPSYKYHAFKGYWLVAGILLNALLSGIVLLTLTIEHKTPAYKLLNCKILRHVGIISYSLYIWQEFFIYYLNNIFSALFFSYLLALLSFVIIEQIVAEGLKQRYGKP